MISGPLRYPGGKSKALKFIAPLIPNFEEYREPFLGGGSVFIYLKQICFKLPLPYFALASLIYLFFI
jgi:site-specific DNA-adenine methylase